MRHDKIEILATWDADAAVWVATSDDLAGLAIEAESLDRLLARLPGVIEDLADANGGGGDIAYRVVASQVGHIKRRA